MNDLKQRLQRAADAVPEPDLDLDRLDRARNRHEMKRRIGGAVVGLSIFVALAVGLASVLGGSGTNPATDPTDEMPTPTAHLGVDEGEYAYEEGAWVTFGDDGVVTKVAYPEQVWYGPDASGRRINEGEDPQAFGPGEYETDAGDLSGLSSDPAVLLEQMIERTSPGGASPEPYDGFTTGAEAPLTAGLVRAIGELLDDDNATPELRAGLAQVLAGLDGANVDVRASDPAGRPAIELRIETERQLHVWWFDPQSLQVAAWTNLDPGVDPDTARIVYVVSGAGIVATTHEELPKLPLVEFVDLREGRPISGTTTGSSGAEFGFDEAAGMLANRQMFVTPISPDDQSGLLDEPAFDRVLQEWMSHHPRWDALSSHLGSLDVPDGHFNIENRPSYFVEITGPETGNCFYFFDATNGEEFLGACFYPARS